MNVQHPAKMRAARLHEMQGSMVVEEVDVPVPGDDDVLVRVRSCGMVPNLVNVLRYFAELRPTNPLPPLPAIFGLDPAGEIVQVGAHVRGLSVGDRVYLNPMRVCNTCRHCVKGDYISCARYTFNAYFGFTPQSKEIFERYRSGGYAEYMHAPAYAAVRIPDNMSFDEAARMGYVGTAYAGLRRANVGPDSTVLINGASGTLGLGAVISALGLGAKRILGVARDRELLDAVKAIAPHRIEVKSTLDGSIDEWVRERVRDEGVDVAIDCLPTGAPYEQFLTSLELVRRGGTMVNVGGVLTAVPIVIADLMTKGVTLIGSTWFDPCHAQEMVALAESRLLDFSVFEHKTFALDQIEDAMESMTARKGGFNNFVIHP